MTECSPVSLAGILHEMRLFVCILFARAESLGYGAAIAPHSPDPQRPLGRRCLCLVDLDFHGIGILSLISCREFESGGAHGGRGRFPLGTPPLNDEARTRNRRSASLVCTLPLSPFPHPQRLSNVSEAVKGRMTDRIAANRGRD